MEFSRQEYWNGLPYPSPGDLPDLGMEPRCPALQADPLPFDPIREVYVYVCVCVCIIFQIIFHYRLLQDTKYGLCTIQL